MVALFDTASTGIRVIRPENVTEVDQSLERFEGVKVIAGGTDIMVQLRARRYSPSALVDISGIADLDRIDVSPTHVRIGANASMTSISDNDTLVAEFGCLRQAAMTVGSKQIQNMATLVGNIMNASPAADTIPSILLYNGVLNFRSVNGLRSVKLEEALKSRGKVEHHPGEWVESITVDRFDGHGAAYAKLGRTRGVDIAVAGAAVIVVAGDVRVAVSAVDARSRILPNAGRFLRDYLGSEPMQTADLQDVIRHEINPIDDIRASSGYRSYTTAVLIRRAFESARLNMTNVSGV